VADYMKEALTNPVAGYYTTRDAVFGERGDFTTAPETSQLVGELVGVWAALEWTAAGCPPTTRIVELGPGRGTLAADLVRGVGHVRGLVDGLTLHLIEVSPSLRRAQWRALGCGPPGSTAPTDPPAEREPVRAAVAHGAVGGARARRAVPVHWHASLADVPAAGPPTFHVAHEFVDALPVHQFVRVALPPPRGGGVRGRASSSSPHPSLPSATAWRERLIDVHPSRPGLRWVLAPGDTPASRALLPRRLAQLSPHTLASLDGLEICPAAAALGADLAHRVAATNGGALIIDYGRGGPPYADSLVALQRHGAVHPLASPGAADLSCRVDFGALAASVTASGAAAAAHGPISQAALLGGLGIAARLEALVDAAGDDEAAVDALVAGATRLVAPDGEGGMGDTYAALAVAPAGRGAPVPF
jgi:NADH dehydrogenase [ubiquinone] 1 alpha subcomplex assembly factor 7